MHWRIQQLYGLEGIFPTGKADYKAECPENEKWQKFKKEFWGEKLLATTEWGLIDFDPQGKDDMVGGELCLMTSIWIYRCSLEKK